MENIIRDDQNLYKSQSQKPKIFQDPPTKKISRSHYKTY